MNKLGFHIISLTLTGIGVSEAKITFKKGLNWITGPSDTGKSFILECIDYMLGGGTKPKPIDEAKDYNTAILEIKRNSDNKIFRLSRSIIKETEQFTLSSDGDEDSFLGYKHDAKNKDTISYFLLSNFQMEDKKVRKNARNTTQSLSFRNLAPLCIITEKKIIKDTSPILRDQKTDETTDKSVFSLLLTGQDDSHLREVPDGKIFDASIQGKIEMLTKLIIEDQSEIDRGKIKDEEPVLQEQLLRLEQTHKKSCEELSQTERAITDKEKQRQTLWTNLRTIDSRLNVLTGLRNRFDLLRAQYNSDLNRLDAIIEASNLVEQMAIEKCPICGAPATCRDPQHQTSKDNLALVATSCLAEANRIRGLMNDLDKTRSGLYLEETQLASDRAEKQTQLNTLTQAIQEHFRPRIQEAIQRTHAIQKHQESIRIALNLIKRITHYETLIKSLEVDKKKKPKADIEQKEITRELDQVCQEIEQRLQNWHCPEMDRVSFNNKLFDIIISGQERKSHGKGVRALTHAAFTLSLLKYCVTNNKPHPGFVVMDSPLVVYKEPDETEEDYAPAVKRSFFMDIASTFADEQVIILENLDAPAMDDMKQAINVIKFTKTKTSGRYGFIPIAQTEH